MNSKKMIKRVLPVAIALLLVLIVSISCVIFPAKESRASLSPEYSGTTYFKLGDVEISADKIYEVFVRGFGDDALTEITDEYLMKNIKSVKDANLSYYDLALQDVEGVDKMITSEIFPKGRTQDNLADDATQEEIDEAIKADNDAIDAWYNQALSGNNLSTLEELRAYYALQYAKKLYVLDYLTDDAIFDIAVSDLKIVDKFIKSAIEYLDESLKLSDDALKIAEAALYELSNNTKKEMLDFVNAEYEEVKTKSTTTKVKYSLVSNDSVTHKNVCEFECSKWNKVEDASALDAKLTALYNAIYNILKENGSDLATLDAMLENKYFPQDVSDTYKEEYNGEFVSEYYAIYIPFNSKSERDQALAQINVAAIDFYLVHFDKYYEEYDKAYNSTEASDIEEASEKDLYARTTALSKDGVKLTRDEVLACFIAIYNNYNSTLKEDDGKLVVDELAIKSIEDIEALVALLSKDVTKDDGANFDLEALKDTDEDLYNFYSKFHYTSAELSKLASQLNTAVTSTLNSLALYDATVGSDDAFDLSKIYTPTSSSNDLYFALKLGFKRGNAFGNSWDDLTEDEKKAKNEEYLKEEIEASYTTTLSSSTLAALRKAQGLVIYDDVVEKLYINSFDSTFEASKKNDNYLVAKIAELEISADDILLHLAKNHGVTTVLALYEQDLFINSKWSRKDLVYSNGKWLTKADEYEEIISEPLQNTMNTYDYYNYYYAQYGYETMTWEEFLNTVYYYYGVKDTESLKWFFIYQDASKRYQDTMATLGEFKNGAFNYDNIVKYGSDCKQSESGTNTLWEVLYTSALDGSYNLIDTIDTEYFGITGYHMLISLDDASGNKIDAAKWNDTQVKYAKEFYEKLKDMLSEVDPEKQEDTWKTFVTTYNNLPVYNLESLGEGVDIRNGVVLQEDTKKLGNLDPEDYNFSVYKSLGFGLVCEDLSEITSTSASNYDKGFVDGIKKVYTSIMDNNGGIAESGLHQYNDGYISGGFGYHIYCATAVSIGKGLDLTVNSKAINVPYSYEGLSKELIIYLTREAEDTDVSVQIDDQLLNLLSDTEINKVFANWYSSDYSYDGVFKEVVDAIRALDKAVLSGITEADNANGDNYWVSAKSKAGDKDVLLTAQREYLLDVLTTYYNSMISRYYTPIASELNGSSSNTGIDYVLLLTDCLAEMSKANPFQISGIVKSVNLEESATAKFPCIDVDGEKIPVTYNKYNGSNSFELALGYTIDSVIEGYTYIADFMNSVLGR